MLITSQVGTLLNGKKGNSMNSFSQSPTPGTNAESSGDAQTPEAPVAPVATSPPPQPDTSTSGGLSPLAGLLGGKRAVRRRGNPTRTAERGLPAPLNGQPSSGGKSTGAAISKSSGFPPSTGGSSKGSQTAPTSIDQLSPAQLAEVEALLPELFPSSGSSSKKTPQIPTESEN
jgi:hypothetical protein